MPSYLPAQAEAFAAQIRNLLSRDDPFEGAQAIVKLLGANPRNNVAYFGFWTPHIAGAEEVVLEILTPTTPINLQANEQELQFEKAHYPVLRVGDFCVTVIDRLTPGTRENVGPFYWLKYQRDGWKIVHDHLACSVPFGVLAPAEYYDLEGMLDKRTDKAHYHSLTGETETDGYLRLPPPVNMLEVHVGTASAAGTIAGLNQIYSTIAEKIRAGQALAPYEEHYISYDAIQLMPIEPPIEHEGDPRFWETLSETDQQVTVQVRQHDITNWGYDVMISASPAINPAILGSKRPDELLDLIQTLHHFPKQPIRFMLDIVYGHTDHQAEPILNEYFLAGENMYGYNMNYKHPVTRAYLLEMQRRKHNYGVDGIRVDGAQDFKWWEPETDQLHHDDDYLRLMNDIVQEVDGIQYRPWMIFEDGRPWPRDDWELASSYREVTKQMPNVWQWGPLTFAHNTPFLFTFWISKWWRILEMAQFGREWITGCANHDTLRRGTQVDPQARINTYLGDSLPEIFENAYDNPAAKLFDYAMMPGIPMDFLNASMRAPWGFIRNTDDRYGVKVVSEEARFVDWTITKERYQAEDMFTRLKALGFHERDELHRFVHLLDHMVQATRYNLPVIVDLLSAVTPPLPCLPLSIEKLKAISRAWMDDMHEYCNTARYVEHQDKSKAAYNAAVRNFRRKRPWLMENLRDEDHFDYLHPVDGSVTFYGLRHAPDGKEQILFVANMEGAPRTLTPAQLPIPNLPQDGWQLLLPLHRRASAKDEITLADSEALVFSRKSE